MKIKEIAQEIHQNNIAKGFWEDKPHKNVGELLMLCVSELSEALEAHRKSKHANLEVYENCIKSDDILEEDKEIYIQQEFIRNIKDTFEDEIADTVIRLFDLSEGLGIDLEKHIRLKLDYNKTRPYKHNKAY